MARSATRSLLRKVPLCRNRPSTRVVFPWSTWAMMATLRRSGLAISEEVDLDGDISPVYDLEARKSMIEDRFRVFRPSILDPRLAILGPRINRLTPICVIFLTVDGGFLP